jgi:hypothetical protein
LGKLSGIIFTNVMLDVEIQIFYSSKDKLSIFIALDRFCERNEDAFWGIYRTFLGFILPFKFPIIRVLSLLPF